MALISEDDDSADTPDNLLMAHGERVCANSAPVLLFFSFEEINSVAMDQQPCGTAFCGERSDRHRLGCKN